MPGTLFPAIVARYVTGAAELRAQEVFAVAFALRVTAAEQVIVKPEGVEVLLRLTVPAKLKVLVSLTDIVVPMGPELKLNGVPTDIAKSPTWTTELVA